MSLQKTSYITVDEAEQYFEGVLDTDAWDDATNAEKTKALIQASTDIDKLEYIGTKTTLQSEHEFPRNPIPEIDPNQIDSDLVPFNVKYAVCEQALAILDGWDVGQEIDGLSLVGAAYSSVKATFDREDIPMHLKCGLTPKAWQFILPFIRDNRAIRLSRVS